MIYLHAGFHTQHNSAFGAFIGAVSSLFNCCTSKASLVFTLSARNGRDQTQEVFSDESKWCTVFDCHVTYLESTGTMKMMCDNLFDKILPEIHLVHFAGFAFFEQDECGK